jgi:hypothetical protein
VNILSFAEVEEKYPITYEPYEGFTVHLPERDILFRRVGKLHVADFWGGQASTYVAGVYQGGSLESYEGTRAATGMWLSVLPGANIHVTGWERVWIAEFD